MTDKSRDPQKACAVRAVDPAEFLAFAADVLKVAPDALSLETAYGSLPEWDSVNHLRLVMEAERRFGVYYPLERIPSMKTLADFVNPAVFVPAP